MTKFNFADFAITQQEGLSGPNRWYRTAIGGHVFDVAIVGSGAITLHAGVDQKGYLVRPHKGSAWTIRLHTTGGGKIDEELGGRHAAKGWEPSCQRHKGFQFARVLFGELWARWHAPIMPAFAQAIVGKMEEGIPRIPSEREGLAVLYSGRLIDLDDEGEEVDILSYDVYQVADPYGRRHIERIRPRTDAEIRLDEGGKTPPSEDEDSFAAAVDAANDLFLPD